MTNQKIENPRLMLARLPNSDYAHAGEEEAIDLVLNEINDIYNKNSICINDINEKYFKMKSINNKYII